MRSYEKGGKSIILTVVGRGQQGIVVSDKEIFGKTFVTSRQELKVAKLEIDSHLYVKRILEILELL